MTDSTSRDHPDASALSEAGAAIKRESRALGGEAKAAAGKLACGQRDALADYIAALADAANSAADDLQAAGYGRSAAPVRRTADQVGGLAEELQQRDPGDLWRNAESFARDHPAVVFGAGMAIAFGVTRFLKSSPPGETGQEQTHGEAASATAD